MRKILKTVLVTYLAIKVVPVMLKSTGFILECFAIGVGEKISKSILREEMVDLSTTSREVDVVFDTRAEAEEVLSKLIEYIQEYKVTSVADFMELIGKTGSFKENNYGWTDLTKASVKIIKGGKYIIDLPKAVVLE